MRQTKQRIKPDKPEKIRSSNNSQRKNSTTPQKTKQHQRHHTDKQKICQCDTKKTGIDYQKHTVEFSNIDHTLYQTLSGLIQGDLINLTHLLEACQIVPFGFQLLLVVLRGAALRGATLATLLELLAGVNSDLLPQCRSPGDPGQATWKSIHTALMPVKSRLAHPPTRVTSGQWAPPGVQRFASLHLR